MKKQKDSTPNMFTTNKFEAKPYKQQDWYFVTNQCNLLYMLAAGMVMSPKGFYNKYFNDTLSTFPGWIPLFLDEIPKSAIELSISEQRHLTPCIVSVNLDFLRGRLVAIDNDSQVREILFPEELDINDRVLLVPSPLPLTCLKSIFFKSKEDRIGCEADANDFENVPLQDFKLKVVANMFSEESGITWPPLEVTLPDKDMAPDMAIASGGIMAILFHMANRGDMEINAYHLAFDPDTTEISSPTDPMIQELGVWVQSGSISDTKDISARLFWGAVDCVAKHRSNTEFMNPMDAILKYLNGIGESFDERVKQALLKLEKDLIKLAGFTDSTVTELLERHTKPFPRAMILFFLRERCSDLLEFEHPLLTELDYVCAAILFGARDGWIGMPLPLRNAMGLQSVISYHMSDLAHRLVKTELYLGPRPSRPLPLRELFKSSEKKWTQKQQKAALLIARESKWLNCIETRINLGKGEYQLDIGTSGIEIILEGEVKAVKTDVNQKRFFNRLECDKISYNVEKKVHDIFLE